MTKRRKFEKPIHTPRTEDGCGKAGYPSKRIADNTITKRLRDNRTLDLRSYLCPSCGLYHITHKPGWNERMEDAS